MKILTIETTGNICGVALSISGKVVADYNNYQFNSHDRLLGVYIKRILSDNKLDPEALDYVGVSAGPGSFTGLRIGGAFAKSLCFGGNVKIIAVPTLDAIANFAMSFNLSFDKICVATRSHKDLVYSKLYSKDGATLRDTIFDTLDNLNNELDNKTLLCGSAFADSNGNTMLLQGATAIMIAHKAFLMAQRGEFVEPEIYEPIYVQEFEPKIIVK